VSSDGVEELPSASGPVRMSVCPADAMVLSNGSLERPRKGILREKRLAEGFKEDRVWLASVDNVAGDVIGSNEGEADGNFGTCSSIDGGVRGESTPACEPDGEAAPISASGDLGCDNETGENHLRAGVVETGAVSDRGRLSTRVSSGLGGVGGMTFVTRYGDSSGTEEPVEVGLVEGSSASTGRELLGFLEDEVDVNQERLLGIDLASAPGQSALAA
jgi:hypothetical protein